MLINQLEPVELAARGYLGGYRTRGDEIVADICPFCGGGKHGRDKHTFAMSTQDGAYNCKRASCGAQGSYYELLQHFRLVDRHKIPARPATRPGARRKKVKRYVEPTTKIERAEGDVAAYLKLRGFSREVWERRGVGQAGGNVAIPYFEDGKLVLVKFRPPRKPKKGERKGWREPGGKAVFWGMGDCDPALPLVIVEGEMDALALDQAGVANVVSVPSGCEDLTCVDICWDWLDKFADIIVWPDADGPGEKMAENLVKRLGAERCGIVRVEYKDANEMLYLAGPEAVQAAVEAAQDVGVDGLIRLGGLDDDDYDPTAAEKVKTGILALDKYLVGGFYLGEITIWSGVNSHGKSTLLGQVMLESIDQGAGVCAFSGELPARVFRYWINLQAAGAAGAGYIKQKSDADGNIIHYVPKNVRQVIQNWYYPKFFLYDNFGDTSADKMFEAFKYAAKRHDCKTFLVDNLGATVFSGNERSFWHDQADFVRKMAKFAYDYDVHVHIVAHPRKVQDEFSDLAKEDIFGSGGITNIANNIITIRRLSQDEQEKEQAAAKICLLKNRMFGNHGKLIFLQFNPESKRFYQESQGERREYGWLKNLPDAETRAEPTPEELYADGKLPF